MLRRMASDIDVEYCSVIHANLINRLSCFYKYTAGWTPSHLISVDSWKRIAYHWVT